jgi:hypothetical protein
MTGMDLIEGAGYRATHGDWSLFVTQSKNSVDVLIVDRAKGNMAGRSTYSAGSMSDGKIMAAEKAGIPASDLTWEHFDAPTPVLF